MFNSTDQFENFQSEIIGKPPNNITRFGISFIFIFVLILMFFAWKIDYSDSINARIVINSKTPTISVVSENSGYINQIFAITGKEVNKGDDIILFRSDSDIKSVTQLKTQLLKGSLTNRNTELSINGHLGSLRSDFQLLQNDINLFLKNRNTLSTKLKIQQLKNDSAALSHQLLDLKAQKKMYIQKNTINQENYNRSLNLSNKNLINKKDLGLSKSSLIDVKLSSSQIDIEINKIKSTLYNNTKKIELYSIESKELLSELAQKIKSQQQLLLDKINSWESRYIVKSPINGTLSLPNNIFIHQNVLLNQELFSISPTVNNLIGKIKIPENGVGKIFLGQPVGIKLDSYPFQEFGKLSGIVRSKSSSVHGSSIYIEIEISNYSPISGKITTSYNKNISYIPNMQGQVEIITNKKNILSRIFENLIARL